LQARKTHQVSTLSLHGHAQQQVTNGADEFRIDFLPIFIRDFCPRHDKKEASTRERKRNKKNRFRILHSTRFVIPHYND
jgi:hypothetical protein